MRFMTYPFGIEAAVAGIDEVLIHNKASLNACIIAHVSKIIQIQLQ